MRVAFLILMRERPLERIKVVDVTKQAGLSRKTFYDYYSDIHDIAYDCFRTYLCRDLSVRVADFGSPALFIDYAVSVFQNNLEFCRGNANFAKMVYEESHFSRYLSRIVDDGIVTMIHSIEDGQPADGYLRSKLFPNVDLVARMYFMGIGMITREWIDRGMEEPSDLVATRIAYMACHLSDMYGKPTGTSAEFKEILLKSLA